MYPWLTAEDVKLKRNKFVGSLFPFQQKGTLFLYMVKKCLLSDATGLGKTVQAIAAFDLLKERYPNFKILVCTLKSTQLQWVEEFEKFMPGFKIEASTGSAKERETTYQKFQHGSIEGLVINYSQLVRDFATTDQIRGPLGLAVHGKGQELIVIFDEAQKCKEPSSKTSKAAKAIADTAYGVKCLTATPIHNRLIDIYGIFKIINPKVFQNKENFKKNFCVLNYAFSPWGTIVGYKNHDRLRESIRGYEFGRAKKEVAQDLPPLLVRKSFVELPPFHQSIYDEILDDQKLNPEEILALMTKEQVCVNTLEHVEGYTGKSSHPKLEEAVRLIDEELEGEKILVFSKFRKTIDTLTGLLKVPTYRVTGVEDQETRQQNIKDWQSQPGTSVLLITTAGGAGLNLQAASTLITIDRPWSGGDLEQVRGRIHRIGSKHESLLEIDIIAKETIDEYVLNLMNQKMKDKVKVLGERDKPIAEESITIDRKDLLQARWEFLQKRKAR